MLQKILLESVDEQKNGAGGGGFPNIFNLISNILDDNFRDQNVIFIKRQAR